MRLATLVVLLLLTGCGGVTHPLVYTRASDPIWPLNPDKWNPPGGNDLVQPPAVTAGRILQPASN